MAKYADYVKQEDEVTKELNEVKTQRNIPDSVIKRFDGKTVEDVLESYANLEKHNSEQVNKLQQTINDLVTLQTRNVPQNPQVTVKPDEPKVTVDDLYTDTETTIGKVVDKKSKATQERIDELEKQLVAQRNNAKLNVLTGKFNTWQTDVKTPEFAEWVKASSYRLRLAAAADKLDFDAADDLLTAWYEFTGQEQKEQQKQQRDQQFRDATLESSGGTVMDVAKPFSRYELQEKRLAAKRGDLKAERWLKSNADAIAIAYEEGRIID